MQPKPGTMGICGCGRSPTGKCCGWHALTEEQYKKARDNYDLAEYQKQAAELWNDSCTTVRNHNDNN
jgi:hypothetical protein